MRHLHGSPPCLVGTLPTRRRRNPQFAGVTVVATNGRGGSVARWKRTRRYAAFGALGLFAIGLVAWGSMAWGTPAANEQTVGEISRWCERVSGGLLRKPVNTLGNLGFVVAGLAMFATLAHDVTTGRRPRNRFIGHSPTALLYASAAVFLGPGSMVMHGSHTFLGARVDNVSMVTHILIL